MSSSNFHRLQPEWPDLHDLASKANSPSELDALFVSLQHHASKGGL
jgi:hypothetical protein